MKYCTKFNSKIFLALACIALTWLSFPFAWKSKQIFPPLLSGFAACICWVPLCVLLQNFSSKRRCYGIALLVLTLASFSSLSWATIAMNDYGNMTFSASMAVAFSWAFGMALLPALGFAMVPWSQSHKGFAAFAAALLMLPHLLLERFPLQGCPWLQPAYSWYAWSYGIQIADIIGSRGIAFIILWINTALFVALRSRSAKALRAPMLTMAIVLFYGIYQLHFNKLEPAAKHIDVGVVQGNIPQDEKWTFAGKRLAKEVYFQESQEMFEADSPDLVIWPEASVARSYPQDLKEIEFDVSYLNNSELLFGTLGYSRVEGKKRYSNNALLVNAKGQVLQSYQKQVLVPFGEYTPDMGFIDLRNWLPPALGDISPGAESVVFQASNFSFGALICYESLFEHLSREMVADGAEFLVNITNDAWFNQSSGPYQHFNFVKFRAIENRRSVVRGANTGISAWIDPKGRVHQRTKLFQRSAFEAKIPLSKQRTFYNRFPQLCFLTCLLLVFLYFWAIREKV